MDQGDQILCRIFPFLFEEQGVNESVPLSLDVLKTDLETKQLVVSTCRRLEAIALGCRGELLVNGACSKQKLSKLNDLWGVLYILPPLLSNFVDTQIRLECNTIVFTTLHHVYNVVAELGATDEFDPEEFPGIPNLQHACVDTTANAVEPGHCILLAQVPIPRYLKSLESVDYFYGSICDLSNCERYSGIAEKRKVHRAKIVTSGDSSVEQSSSVNNQQLDVTETQESRSNAGVDDKLTTENLEKSVNDMEDSSNVDQVIQDDRSQGEVKVQTRSNLEEESVNSGAGNIIDIANSGTGNDADRGNLCKQIETPQSRENNAKTTENKVCTPSSEEAPQELLKPVVCATLADIRSPVPRVSVTKSETEKLNKRGPLTYKKVLDLHLSSPSFWGSFHSSFSDAVLHFGVTHSNLLTAYHMALYSQLEILEKHADSMSDFETRYCELCHTITHVIGISHPPIKSLVLEMELVTRQVQLLMECGWSASALLAAKELATTLKVDIGRWRTERTKEIKAARLRRGIARPKPRRRLVPQFHPSPVDAADPDYLIAELEDIWLQVDPIVNRTMKEYYNAHSTVMEEEMTSTLPGMFRMYKGQLEWVAVSRRIKRQARKRRKNRNQLASQVRSGDLALFDVNSALWGCKRMLASISPCTKDALGIEEKQHEDLPSWGPKSLSNEFRNPKYEVRESLIVIKVKDVQQFTWGKVDEDLYFLSILGTQVYKFFPFNFRVVTELLKAITHLTGLEAFTDRKYSLMLKEKELEKLRERVLDEFLGERCEWITHTKDLYDTIYSITKNNNAVNMYDLERLFHSCRMNRQVLVETFNIVEALWRTKLAPRDQGTRIKILCIIDRLLDPQVINGDSEMVNRILHWLRITETTLDAGTCKLSLKHITKLLEKVPKLQTHRITSISPERVSELTDHADDFEKLTNYFY